MGAGQAQPITSFTKIQAKITQCGIIEFDRMALMFNDVIEQAEGLRCRIVSSRELLLRIPKVHLFKSQSMVNAFRVWVTLVQCFGQVKFKSDWENYDDPQMQRFEIEPQANDASTVMHLGNQALKKLFDKYRPVPSKPKLVYADVGECKDKRLNQWIPVLREYMESLKEAQLEWPFIVERSRALFARFNELRSNKDHIAEQTKVMNDSQKSSALKKLSQNICEYMTAKSVIDDFYKRLPLMLNDIREFLLSYKGMQQEGLNLSQQIAQKFRIKEGLFTDKIKLIINEVFKDEISEEQLQSDQLIKQRRRSQIPTDSGPGKNEPPGEFLSKYYYIGDMYLDTQFAVQAVSLSELQRALHDGMTSRKKLFKLTGVGKWNDKSIQSAFEVMTWQWSADLNGCLIQSGLELLDRKPFIIYRGNKKFAHDGKTGFELLENILEWFAPSRSKRLANHYLDFKEKLNLLDRLQDEIHILIRQLHPQDQYRAMTSYFKNIELNKRYMKRAKVLYENIILIIAQDVEKLFENHLSIILRVNIHIKYSLI